MQPTNGGWRVWLLGISGVIIVILISALFSIAGSMYSEAKADRKEIIARLDKLEHMNCR